jgi:hypothetical protein
VEQRSSVFLKLRPKDALPELGTILLARVRHTGDLASKGLGFRVFHHPALFYASEGCPASSSFSVCGQI